MTKLRILLVLVFCMAGGLYYSLVIQPQKEAEYRRNLPGCKLGWKGTVVYARRDLPAGTTISRSDLIEQEVDGKKITRHTLWNIAITEGRTLKNNLPKGQFISDLDFEPPFDSKDPLYVKAKLPICKGQPIDGKDFEFGKANSSLHSKGIQYRTLVIQHRANKDIPVGTIITESDLAN